MTYLINYLILSELLMFLFLLINKEEVRKSYLSLTIPISTKTTLKRIQWSFLKPKQPLKAKVSLQLNLLKKN